MEFRRKYDARHWKKVTNEVCAFQNDATSAKHVAKSAKLRGLALLTQLPWKAISFFVDLDTTPSHLSKP